MGALFQSIRNSTSNHHSMTGNIDIILKFHFYCISWTIISSPPVGFIIFIFTATLVFLFHRYGEEDTGRVYMPGAGFYCEQPI